jgi:lysyl-tRNA synthetase class 2
MGWIRLNSSVLAAVWYHSNQLHVEFCTGEIYRYRGVPASVYRKLLSAPSHGTFFNAKVRDAYPFDHIPASSAAAFNP